MDGTNGLESLRAQRADTTREIRNAQQRHRRHDESRELQSLTLRQKAVALTILVTTNWNVMAASLWVSSERRFASQNRMDAVHRLSARFDAWQDPIEHSIIVRDVQSSPATSREKWKREAQKFLGEARAAEWLQKQNANKGFAPASRHVAQVLVNQPIIVPWEHDCTRDIAVEAIMGPLLEEEKMTNTQRQHIVRWRKRWHITLKKIRGKEEISTEEITEKALSAPQKYTKVTPKMGPKSEPQKGGRQTTFI